MKPGTCGTFMDDFTPSKRVPSPNSSTIINKRFLKSAHKQDEQQPLKPVNPQTFDNTASIIQKVQKLDTEDTSGVGNTGSVTVVGSIPPPIQERNLRGSSPFHKNRLPKTWIQPQLSEEPHESSSESNETYHEASIELHSDPIVLAECVSKNSEKTYPTLLTERYCPRVSVDVPQHMERSLAPDDAVLDLSDVARLPFNAHWAGPLNQIPVFDEDADDELKLLFLLDQELCDSERCSDSIPKSRWQSLISWIKTSDSSRDYHSRYPWAQLLATDDFQTKEDDASDDCSLDQVFRSIYI